MSEHIPDAAAPTEPAGEQEPVEAPSGRRRPGRAPGSPRVAGSGRKPGTPNSVTRSVRETIQLKGRPVEFLCGIVAGRKVRVGPQAGPEPQYVYPSLDQRLEAATILLRKVAPDLASVESTSKSEVTGANGEPLFPAGMNPELEVARRLSFLLARGERAAEAERAPESRPSAPTASATAAPAAHAPSPAAAPSATEESIGRPERVGELVIEECE